jgi:hypothetical protein
MAIADFVLLHNRAAEALAKENRVGFDFYSGIADLKALLLKFANHLKGSFAQWYRRIALFPPAMEKSRQLSPLLDS